MLQLINAVSAPTGAWPSIINWVQSFMHSYGWTLILITVVLKLIMLPLDFWMKFSQKKMVTSQAAIKPELDAINKKYAYDKNILNQKQSEVYKKHGVNPMGSCLPMVLNLAVVFTVFISLVNSLTSMSNYKIQDQFYKLQTVYEQTLVENGGDVEGAENAVVAAYKDPNTGIKDSFLWIKNIWRKDTSESVIPTYKEAVPGYNEDLEKASDFYKNVTEEEYNKIMQPLMDEYGSAWNGYYLLVVIAVVFTLLNGLVTQMGNKKDKTGAANKSNWTMQIVMVAIMGVFCFISSSTFALYLAVSQILTALSQFAINPLVDLAIAKSKNKKPKNKNNKSDGEGKVSYSRY